MDISDPKPSLSKPVLAIRWPLGEPVRTTCQFGDPILAPERFLRNWDGFDSAATRDILLEKGKGWCSQIELGNTSGWLLGDVPGAFFPGTAKELGTLVDSSSSALALLKWVSAPRDYGLPTICTVTRENLGRKLFSKTWHSTEEEHYLFCSNEAGEEVLQRRDVPIVTFRSGICIIDMHELRFPAGSEGCAEFELYLFSGTFVSCRWNPPSMEMEPP